MDVYGDDVKNKSQSVIASIILPLLPGAITNSQRLYQ